MKLAWIKISGWPDSYSERMDELAKAIDGLLVVRAKRLNGVDHNPKWNLKEFRPGRQAYLKPRIKVLFYPLWVLLGSLALARAVQGREYDVIHAANFPFDALAGALTKIITSLPLVVSVRGLQLPRYDDDRNRVTSFKNRIVRAVLYFLNRVSLSFADGIVTKAEYQQEYIRETYQISVPMVSIPTGVDFKKFDPKQVESSDIVDELVDEDHNHVFLHLGKLVPGKGVNKLIENIGNLRNESIGFLLIGDFQNKGFESFIEGRIEELGIENQVTIHKGKISYESVPEILKGVDGVCLLSRSGVEGVPRVLQESVVMETPIIATNVNGIKSVFKNKRGCYLIAPEDTREFINIVDSPASLQSPDRTDFESSLNIESNYSKYHQFYQNLINDI